MNFEYIYSTFLFCNVKTYRRERIISFLDPWSDPEQKGFKPFSPCLVFILRFFWCGLGQGQGKLFFLPEAHMDFTAAVLGEEWALGFVAVLAFCALWFFEVSDCD